MDFSEEWKSLWPIASVYSPPLLLRTDDSESQSPPSKRRRSEEGVDVDDEGGGNLEQLGPLIFIPNCESLIELYSSPDLAPGFPPPYPSLSLPRFLSTSSTSLLPSTASSIASQFGPQLSQTDVNGGDFSSSYVHDLNRLQLLTCGDESCLVLLFFPTGENCDQVGYVMLGCEDSQFSVKINEINNKVFIAKEKFNQRILKLSVNPIVDAAIDDNLSGGTPSHFAAIGYLMACSMHSAHWYVVKTVRESEIFRVKSALLDFIGSKSFRSSTIVHSCWSPHLREESVVLLENGQIYLFDLSSCFKEHWSSNNRVTGKKLQVLWDVNSQHGDNIHGGRWLSCEFSWHPRILIVAHSTAVFMVDARTEGCNTSCLLKIQMLSTILNDGFIALSRAGSDGFSFCVASKRLLFLCDMRQPWRPLLQWMHNLDNPRFLTVFGLCELRSSTGDDKYKWASESGSCILLGSFWSGEFSLFIYGPNNARRSVSSEISKFCNSFYAWGLPSELSLSARDCCCGTCQLRYEFLEDSLPKWVDWRQKKHLVMGFAILPSEHFAQLPKIGNSGGFSLIRLMSSGKLEAQSYCATQKFHRISREAHLQSLFNSGENLFYDTHVFYYDLEKKFQHLKLDYFTAYLKGNLAEILADKLKHFREAVTENEAENQSSQNLETHESNLIMFKPFKSFEDITFPISIREIALRDTWSRSKFSVSSQSVFPRVAEFLRFSHQMDQFPFQTPSCHHNKLLYRIRPSDDLWGSFLPPQFLLTLHRLNNQKLRTKVDVLSADSEIKLQCDSVLEVADKLQDVHGISLLDDSNKLSDVGENLQSFSLHKLGGLSEISVEDIAPVNSETENERFTKFIFRKHQEQVCDVDVEVAGLELLDAGCPLELKFNNNSIPFGQEELKQFKFLKEQDTNFQKGFLLYQEFITKTN